MININYFISKTTIFKNLLKKHQKKWGVNMGPLQKSHQKQFKNRIKQYKMVENLFITGKKIIYRNRKHNWLFHPRHSAHIWHITHLTHTSPRVSSENFPSQKLQVASLESGLSPPLTFIRFVSSSLQIRGGSSSLMSPMMNRIVAWAEFSFFEGLSSSHPALWPVSYPGKTQGRLLESTCQASWSTDPCMVIR